MGKLFIDWVARNIDILIYMQLLIFAASGSFWAWQKKRRRLDLGLSKQDELDVVAEDLDYEISRLVALKNKISSKIFYNDNQEETPIAKNEVVNVDLLMELNEWKAKALALETKENTSSGDEANFENDLTALKDQIETLKIKNMELEHSLQKSMDNFDSDDEDITRYMAGVTMGKTQVAPEHEEKSETDAEEIKRDLEKILDH